jgi:hypothetical protein
MSVAWLMKQDPKQLAGQLIEATRDRPEWLAAFAGELASQALIDPLHRFLGVWGLSASEAARLFGVSRQALSKWSAHGIPTDRREMIAELSAATDLLSRYLKLDRIAATVRRDAARLGGRSLLDLVAAGDSRGALEACRAMFEFSTTQA